MRPRRSKCSPTWSNVRQSSSQDLRAGAGVSTLQILAWVQQWKFPEASWILCCYPSFLLAKPVITACMGYLVHSLWHRRAPLLWPPLSQLWLNRTRSARPSASPWVYTGRDSRIQACFPCERGLGCRRGNGSRKPAKLPKTESRLGPGAKPKSLAYAIQTEIADITMRKHRRRFVMASSPHFASTAKSVTSSFSPSHRCFDPGNHCAPRIITIAGIHAWGNIAGARVAEHQACPVAHSKPESCSGSCKRTMRHCRQQAMIPR